MSFGNLLVMQLARLGDLVQTWPLLRRLRHAYPDARLALLSDAGLQDLEPLGPRVNEFRGLNFSALASVAQGDVAAAYRQISGLLQDLRAADYDLVVNLNFSRVSLLLSYLLGTPVWGYRPMAGGREFSRNPWLALVYSLVHARCFNRLHLSDVFRHLAPPAAGEPGPPALRSPSGEPVIALQLATRHIRRTWPVENFASLAARLIDRLGARLYLLGTAGECPLGQSLTAALPPSWRERVVNLQGRTSLTELAACLQEAHLLVSGDTGTLHLAAALGTLTVALFLGPASCFETGPYGAGHYVFQAEPPCHPCLEAQAGCDEPFCPAMLSPEVVAGLILDIYRHEPPGGRHLPAHTRLYRSCIEPLGVRYEPVHRTTVRWSDLVGQAYRRAAASLVGAPPPVAGLPLGRLGHEYEEALQALAACLHNDAAVEGLPPPVAAALTPLRAFRAELARQAAWEAPGDDGEAAFQTVKAALLMQIKEWSGSPVTSHLWNNGDSVASTWIS